MRNPILLAVLAGLVGVGVVYAESVQTTLYYGDFTLPPGSASHQQPGQWDMFACPLTINYQLDLSGAPNVAYDGNLDNIGIVGAFGDGAGVRMAGFLYDTDNGSPQFPTYPDMDGIQDSDDKFIMRRFPNPGSYDEQMYDVWCASNTVGAPVFDPLLNYGIWFDRDGVDSWQATRPGMVNGGTYNTNGTYSVEVLFRSASALKGTACATLAPQLPNSWSPTGHGIPTGFDHPAAHAGWLTFYPAGISFDTDQTKMASMQVYVQGASGGGAIVVRNLTASGCLVVTDGMAIGGGWYIPDDSRAPVLTNPGGKATFGFVAKNKDSSFTGNLEFQYQADGLSLKSSSYDWANISATQAMFAGVGTLTTPVGVVENARFRVQAVDGDKTSAPDHFSIRIWTGDEANPVHLSEGDLQGGQIVVHKK